jgi:hypothetical protein
VAIREQPLGLMPRASHGGVLSRAGRRAPECLANRSNVRVILLLKSAGVACRCSYDRWAQRGDSLRVRAYPTASPPA